MKIYKNIALSGGSSKGYAYIGVLKSLEENKLINNLNSFLGTSVGSIFATLFAMGFKSSELIEYMDETFEIEDVNIEYLFENYGVCSGNEIMDFIGRVISKKYKKEITFKELKFLRNNNLIICVTYLNKHKIEYLSYENYPNMKIIDAIRFSITLPYIFCIKKYENKIFMDAALIENISFYNFDPKETIAVVLTDKINIKENNEINTIESFTKNLFLCIKKNFLNKKNEKYKIIKLVCENIDILDFSLNLKTRQYLLDTGYDTTNTILKMLIKEG